MKSSVSDKLQGYNFGGISFTLPLELPYTRLKFYIRKWAEFIYILMSGVVNREIKIYV